jgi:hypothetical protein
MIVDRCTTSYTPLAPSVSYTTRMHPAASSKSSLMGAGFNQRTKAYGVGLGSAPAFARRRKLENAYFLHLELLLSNTSPASKCDQAQGPEYKQTIHVIHLRLAEHTSKCTQHHKQSTHGKRTASNATRNMDDQPDSHLSD